MEGISLFLVLPLRLTHCVNLWQYVQKYYLIYIEGKKWILINAIFIFFRVYLVCDIFEKKKVKT